MLTAYETISYGNEYCRSFSGFLLCGCLVVLGCHVHSEVDSAPSLPPSLPCTVFACFLTLISGSGSSKHPQCSVKILSCTFAFSTHVWFSTSFFSLYIKTNKLFLKMLSVPVFINLSVCACCKQDNATLT